jgi:hypothetical protein
MRTQHPRRFLLQRRTPQGLNPPLGLARPPQAVNVSACPAATELLRKSASTELEYSSCLVFARTSGPSISANVLRSDLLRPTSNIRFSNNMPDLSEPVRGIPTRSVPREMPTFNSAVRTLSVPVQNWERTAALRTASLFLCQLKQAVSEASVL